MTKKLFFQALTKFVAGWNSAATRSIYSVFAIGSFPLFGNFADVRDTKICKDATFRIVLTSNR